MKHFHFAVMKQPPRERKLKETRSIIEEKNERFPFSKDEIIVSRNSRFQPWGCFNHVTQHFEKSIAARWDDVDELRIIFREGTGCFLSQQRRVEYCFRIESRMFRSNDEFSQPVCDCSIQSL